jgi:hypothetical protein
MDRSGRDRPSQLHTAAPNKEDRVKRTSIILATILIMVSAAAVSFAAEAAEPEATCSASCGAGGSVSCSGTYCESKDDNCPSSDGWVRCDGRFYSCGGCPCPDEGDLCYSDADCRDSGYPICDFCRCELMFADPGASDDTDDIELPRGYCKCMLD